MTRKLVILAEECARTEEALEIFKRRGWTPVNDQSTPLPGRRQVRKEEHDTPLIKLIIEEWEYGVDEK